jgi:hypothetical protein
MSASLVIERVMGKVATGKLMYNNTTKMLNKDGGNPLLKKLVPRGVS